jgi:hypothetical protein
MRMTELAKASSNYKRQTHPVVSEGVTYCDRKCSVEKILVVSLKGLVAKTN